MKHQIAVLAFAAAARLVTAEVAVIRGGESTQPSGEKSSVIIRTNDRDIVPMTATTKESKSDAGTHTETVTRLRDGDGNYFEWQRATDVVREVAPGKTERTREVIERDRQGGERERKVVKESALKTGNSERTETTESRRDSSGRLVLAREIAARSTKNNDGTIAQTRTENDYDVNGRPFTKREIESATTPSIDGHTKTTVSTTKSFDHLAAGVGVTARETATVRVDGNTTHSEALVQKPSGAGWENDKRVVSVETRATDGTTQRETVIEGRSLYARQTGGRTEADALTPQTRIVEREVRHSDGTVVIHRDVYRRDVNGDWKPTTFSTEAAAAGY